MLDIVKKNCLNVFFVCDDFTNNSTAPIKLLCLIPRVTYGYLILFGYFYVAIKYLIIEVNYQKNAHY